MASEVCGSPTTTPTRPPYDDSSEWLSIGAALRARGRSREDGAKVLGGNFRRVFAEVAAV